MRIFFLCTTIWLFPIFLIGQDTTKVNIHNVNQYIGKEVTICDKVTDTFKSLGDDKPMYLNFGGKYPDILFTAVIFAKDQSKFNYNPVDVYKDQNICVSGTITEYKGKPQMVITNPIQIRIMQ